MLDDAFAILARRQVDVDIRILGAFLGEKAFEEQVSLDRVDCRDAESVADDRVGRRTAALREYLLRTAKLRNVPDEQEIAGEIELGDHIELVI